MSLDWQDEAPEADRNPYSSPETDAYGDPRASPPIFKAWLLFFLAATFIGFGVGLAVGAVAGGIMGTAGVDVQTIEIVGQLGGFLLSIPISYLSFRWSVRKYLL